MEVLREYKQPLSLCVCVCLSLAFFLSPPIKSAASGSIPHIPASPKEWSRLNLNTHTHNPTTTNPHTDTHTHPHTHTIIHTHTMPFIMICDICSKKKNENLYHCMHAYKTTLSGLMREDVSMFTTISV